MTRARGRGAGAGAAPDADLHWGPEESIQRARFPLREGRQQKERGGPGSKASSKGHVSPSTLSYTDAQLDIEKKDPVEKEKWETPRRRQLGLLK